MKNLLQLIISVEVDEDANIHSGDGQDDAGEGDGRELVDELDADEHDHAHDEQQPGAVHAEVVVHRLRVLRKVPEDRHPRSHVCLRKGSLLMSGFLPLSLGILPLCNGFSLNCFL